MSLKDYFRDFQQQDDSDTVFSEPLESQTRIIPPEKKEIKKTTRLKIVVKSEELGESLFKQSGTSLANKERWLELYHKALSSKKSNSITLAMKKGLFLISDKNEICVLTKYVKGESANVMLDDKWL